MRGSRCLQHPEPRVFSPVAATMSAPIVSRKLALDIYRLAWPVLVAQLAVMAYAVIDPI